MSQFTDKLGSIADKIRADFIAKDTAREKALPLCREAIRCCSRAIRAIHLWNAQKEFAEGSITLALITQKNLPSPDELGIDYASYLNGLGEAVGELRRYIPDSLRKGDQSRGEELLQAMDDIYDVLVTMDFPDAITGGLRHTTDMVRGVLERTRSDLTLAIQQKSLEDKLGKFKNNL